MGHFSLQETHVKIGEAPHPSEFYLKKNEKRLFGRGQPSLRNNGTLLL